MIAFGNIKNYFFELSALLGVIFSISFFLFSFFNYKMAIQTFKNKENVVKFQKMQEMQAVENVINSAKEDYSKESFKKLLYNFEVVEIYKQKNVLIAVVKKNFEAKENLLKLVDNIEFIEKNDELYEIKWIPKEEGGRIKIDCVCFFDESNWQIWINNVCYDEKNRKINDNIYIKEVKKDFIIISNNNCDEKIIYGF